MRLGIVGSRTFNDYLFLKEQILKNFKISDIKLIVSGGAAGADSLSEVFAKEFDIPIKIFRPKWNDLDALGAVIKINKFGKKYNVMAGFDRNKDIVDSSDVVIAFHKNNSSGTNDSIEYARQMGKKCIVIKV